MTVSPTASAAAAAAAAARGMPAPGGGGGSLPRRPARSAAAAAGRNGRIEAFIRRLPGYRFRDTDPGRAEQHRRRREIGSAGSASRGTARRRAGRRPPRSARSRYSRRCEQLYIL